MTIDHSARTIPNSRGDTKLKGGVGVANNSPSVTPSTAFQLTISIRNVENDQAISFKQDGQRFGTSPKTLKLFSNAKYKCEIKCRPASVEFHNLHLGGSDLELISEHLHTSPGDYTAVWNTTGIDPSKRGARNDLLFILSGPAGSLRKKVQTKFYAPGDKHGEWGPKADSLVWNCEANSTGAISVTSEEIR